MKNAVITGTSTGIGLTTSLHMARNGYRVFAGMRNVAKADALRAAAKAEALPVEIVQLDICDPDSVTAAFASAITSTKKRRMSRAPYSFRRNWMPVDGVASWAILRKRFIAPEF